MVGLADGLVLGLVPGVVVGLIPGLMLGLIPGLILEPPVPVPVPPVPPLVPVPSVPVPPVPPPAPPLGEHELMRIANPTNGINNDPIFFITPRFNLSKG